MKNIFKKTAGTILVISIICTAMAGCTASDNGNDKSNATEKATQAVANEQTKTEHTKTEPTKTGAFVIKAGPYEDVEDLGITAETTNSNHRYLDTISVNGEYWSSYSPIIDEESGIKDIFKILMGYKVNEPDENGVFEYSETDLGETVKLSIPYEEAGMNVLCCKDGIAYDVKAEYIDGCYVFETSQLGVFMMATKSTGRTEPVKSENLELAQQTLVDKITGIEVSGMLPVGAEMKVSMAFFGDHRVCANYSYPTSGTLEEDYPELDDISEFYYTLDQERDVNKDAGKIGLTISKEGWTSGRIGTGMDSTLEARITFIKNFEILDFESDLTVTLPFDYREGLIKGSCISEAIAKQYDYDSREFIDLEVIPKESTKEGTFQFKIKTPGQFFFGDEIPLNSNVKAYMDNKNKQ